MTRANLSILLAFAGLAAFWIASSEPSMRPSWLTLPGSMKAKPVAVLRGVDARCEPIKMVVHCVNLDTWRPGTFKIA